MFKFSSVQKVFNIGGVEIGGQPGEYPTVLIGSIFFAGHNIVSDPIKGLFNIDKAKYLLDQESKVSLTTGNPRFIDVIGITPEALINYIEFVAENTLSPILVDSPSQQVRLAAIMHFAGTDVMPRLIYNAIAEDYTDEELACLRDCGVKSSIVLAFSNKAMKPQAKIKLLQDNLLPAAKKAEIENILIDMGVMDVPSVSWVSLAINEAKEKLGYPVGCAPANAIYTWTNIKARGTSAFYAASSAVFSMPKLLGADFILYGSLHNAPWVYPAVATIDGLIAYSGRFTGVQVKTGEHPLYKVF
jgi:tetrahydromethanopterin S-methyltransferase subunit H